MSCVKARFITGDEVTLRNCLTVRDVKVQIAALREKFLPEIVILSKECAELTDYVEAPEEVQVVVNDGGVHDVSFWYTALLEHAKAEDTASVERAKTAIEKNGRRCGRAFCSKVLLDYLRDHLVVVETSCVRALISCEADVNTFELSSRFRSMMHCAVKRGAPSGTIQALIDAGATVDPNDLFEAAYSGDSEARRAFIATGTDPNMEFSSVQISLAHTHAQLNDGDTLLLLAARYWNATDVQALLAARADVNFKTPLCEAVRFENFSAFRALIAGGAELHSVNLLELAMRDGHPRGEDFKRAEVIKVLLAAGVTVPPQVWAIFFRRAESLLEIIAPEIDVNMVVDILNAKGCTLSVEDMREKPVEALKGLISAGANIDSATSGTREEFERKDKEAQLVEAILEMRVEAVRTLIAAGASVNFETENGMAPLLHAVGAQIRPTRGGLFGAIETTKENPSAQRAFEENRSEILRTLVAASANVNFESSTGSTPLKCAAIAHTPCIETLRSLIAAGASVNMEDKYGRTPLMDCISSGVPEAVHALIAANADVNCATSKGYTALQHAVMNCMVEALPILVAAGANLDCATHCGDTPLLYALRHQMREFATALIAAGASVNCENSAGVTPLLLADTTTIRDLVAAGARVNYENRAGISPLIYAATHGATWLMNALIAANASVNTESRSGFTPLLCAVEECHLEAVRILIAAGVDVTYETKDGRNPGLLVRERARDPWQHEAAAIAQLFAETKAGEPTEDYSESEML